MPPHKNSSIIKVVYTIAELRAELKKARSKGASVGLVPTMGALHAGHISLISASCKENDFTVSTIFVNPTQFNNPDDLKKYPVSIEKDLNMLEKEGTDLVFMPDEKEMYPAPSELNFSMGRLENTMEGAHRPGHFHGVAFIVSKLFYIIQPDKAYFGQKDLQQYLIIKHLRDHLFFDIQLECMPIIREESGLAMSSRNRRLSEKGKVTASILYKTLNEAKELLLAGKSSEDIKTTSSKRISNEGVKLEYFEIVNADNLSPDLTNHTGEIAICVAAYVEDVRLIDNTLVTL